MRHARSMTHRQTVKPNTLGIEPALVRDPAETGRRTLIAWWIGAYASEAYPSESERASAESHHAGDSAASFDAFAHARAEVAADVHVTAIAVADIRLRVRGRLTLRHLSLLLLRPFAPLMTPPIAPATARESAARESAVSTRTRRSDVSKVLSRRTHGRRRISNGSLRAVGEVPSVMVIHLLSTHAVNVRARQACKVPSPELVEPVKRIEIESESALGSVEFAAGSNSWCRCARGGIGQVRGSTIEMLCLFVGIGSRCSGRNMIGCCLKAI